MYMWFLECNNTYIKVFMFKKIKSVEKKSKLRFKKELKKIEVDFYFIITKWMQPKNLNSEYMVRLRISKNL